MKSATHFIFLGFKYFLLVVFLPAIILKESLSHTRPDLASVCKCWWMFSPSTREVISSGFGPGCECGSSPGTLGSISWRLFWFSSLTCSTSKISRIVKPGQKCCLNKTLINIQPTCQTSWKHPFWITVVVSIKNKWLADEQILITDCNPLASPSPS